MRLRKYKVTHCKNTKGTGNTDGTEIMIEGSFCNRANSKSSDGKEVACDSGSCDEEHGVEAENSEGSNESNRMKISLQEIIPISSHEISTLLRINLWPLSMTKILWSIMYPSLEFSNAIFIKFLSAGLSPWL